MDVEVDRRRFIRNLIKSVKIEKLFAETKSFPLKTSYKIIRKLEKI